MPVSLLAHVDFTLPLGQVTATPLPAAPLGSGAWRFEVAAGWAKLPANVSLGPTHGGVGVDKAGRIYVSTDADNTGSLVFDASGKFLKAIAPEFSGIHGFSLREEGGREYIYAAHVKGAQAVKLDLDGRAIWKLGVPRESGFYDQPADAKKKPTAYRPTAVAVGPDGRVYVADGYGASVIHVYSAQQKYLKTIGTRGEGDGQFKTCHGIALDTRFGAPLLLVCDRENRRLVHLDLEGKFVRTVATGLRRPCAVSIQGEFVAVAELEGRVVVVDKSGAIVVTLGDNPDQKQWAAFKLAPELWRDGIFIAPHGVSFDRDGNLFVQDWNFAGRLTKLQRAVRR
ncbi:MAG: 6-bladed beta-propeller [Verrucomicrobia bacterium]|nr:6-bladed beta-propeller [Verrucomicrobiota bacterium]